jgi:hypothetical protein
LITRRMLAVILFAVSGGGAVRGAAFGFVIVLLFTL